MKRTQKWIAPHIDLLGMREYARGINRKLI